VAKNVAAKKLTPENAARCNRELDTATSKLNEVDLSDDERAKRAIIVIYQQHVGPAQKIAGITGRAGVLEKA
jgi:hypothetical protein